MKAATIKYILLVAMMFFLLITPSQGDEMVQNLSAVLSESVQDGRINYPQLCGNSRFREYIRELQRTDPERILNPEELLAFWINAYNAYTLKIICDNYPIDSISSLHTGGLVLGTFLKQTVWHKPLVIINGEKTSLDHIEHQILRKEFEEPRIHFAIVCAAKGCPPLRREAYVGSRIGVQLTDQAKIFLAQEEKNSFDLERKIAKISPIFSWFKEDFGDKPRDVLLYLSQFLPDDIAEDIKTDPGAWKVRYTKYDWELNGR